MIRKILAKLFKFKSPRECGREFAFEYLQNGGTYEQLIYLANNPFDFNDFDQGILDVVRNRPMIKNEP